MATATLITLILLLFVNVIVLVIVPVIMTNTINMMLDENATAGTFSESKVPFYVSQFQLYLLSLDMISLV
jgi:hypothetical protein